jgi:hypothetical protein
MGVCRARVGVYWGCNYASLVCVFVVVGGRRRGLALAPGNALAIIIIITIHWVQ